jgi:hypothetical protein
MQYEYQLEGGPSGQYHNSDDISKSAIQHVIIRTSYERNDPANVKRKAKGQKRENTEFTEKERQRAERAVHVVDIEDLKAKVSHSYWQNRSDVSFTELLLQLLHLYSGGRKRSSGSYVKLDMEVIPRYVIRASHCDNSMITVVQLVLT